MAPQGDVPPPIQMSSQPDSRAPGADRQAELEAAYAANVAAGHAPYAGVRVTSLGEFEWILQVRGWARAFEMQYDEPKLAPGEFEDTIERERTYFYDEMVPSPQLSGVNLQGVNLGSLRLWRPNFRHAKLEGVNLAGSDLKIADFTGARLLDANLAGSNLSGATLAQADLSGANLRAVEFGTLDWGHGPKGANLAEAHLDGADCTGGHFGSAHLERASLNGATFQHAGLTRAHLDAVSASGADFSDADLSLANLRGARLAGAKLGSVRLRQTDLRGADLRAIRLDAFAEFAEARLDTHPYLADVVWNGTPLARIDWIAIRRLGDEEDIGRAKTRAERVSAYKRAARGYRGLSLALRQQGLLVPAAEYRLREQRLERAAALRELRLGAWFFSAILDLVAGYGERPIRILLAYLTVVAVFASVYLGVTHGAATQVAQLTWDEALVLSVTSFHGRGFFPGGLSLGDWVARIAAVEAVVGLFLELILLATFSRRFLGNG